MSYLIGKPPVDVTETAPGYIRKIERVIDDVTLVNNTAKTEIVTVPAGKRWRITYLYILNGDDVVRTSSIVVYRDADEFELIAYITDLGVSASARWPIYTVNGTILKASFVDLEAGDSIRFTWQAGGASAGGTAKIKYIYQEATI